MASLPLQLHHVLEEEYVAMYGPLVWPGVQYDEADVLDAERARDRLRACGIDVAPVAANVVKKLNELVTTNAAPSALASSPAITDRGLLLLAQYDELAALADERDKEWGALELRREIVDEALNGAVKALRDVRLDNVYRALHTRAKDEKNPQPRTALCISGGGIRSATFALGVIQGLASAGVLKTFDYLSTVSGGGYIGSWLSSWVRRHPDGVAGVEDELHRADTAIGGRAEQTERTDRKVPDTKIDPEPAPVRHLRDYSNYLSPRLGLLSGDSWALASHYVRNVLLNLLVLIPLLAFVLAIPRFFSWGLMQNRFLPPLWHPWIATISTIIAFAYIGAARPLGGMPNRSKKLSSNTGYLIGVVVPLVVASAALALFWARAAYQPSLRNHDSTIAALAAAFLGMVLVPWAVYYVRIAFMTADARRTGFMSTTDHRKYLLSKAVVEFIAVTVALATSAALFYLLAREVFPDPLRATPRIAELAPYDRLGVSSTPTAQLYVCLAVPAALLVLFVQASIFVGLSSRRNEDGDREWWGRGGALLLMTAVGLAIFCFVAVFGPVALYHAPKILGSIGGLAGVAAAFLGFSDKTPANQKQKEAAGTTAKLGNLASALAVPLFVTFILALVSLGSTWLIHHIWDGGIDAGQWARSAALKSDYSETTRRINDGKIIQQRDVMPAAPLASLADLRAMAHLDTVQKTTTPQLALFLLMATVAGILSFFIGVNKFSMHALYRNRLIRAYLGASRTRREPDPFTGFDENDNLQMSELRADLLWKTGIKEGFVGALRNASGDSPRQKLAACLWKSLATKTQELLEKQPVEDIACDALAQNLNHLLMTRDLAAEAGIPAPAWLRCDPKKEIGYSLAFRNRALLDEHFGDCLTPMPRPGTDGRPPLHVINTALNITSGRNIGWQQRMAESFTVSPFHSGSLYVGYRGTHEYGGTQGISLGSAVTISGAAASPNMGYHSSPAIAFLLTIFNIRLGSWLGNPGLRGQTSYNAAHPKSNLVPLIAELTGGSNDQSKWVYLSDGGHFENLGLYEMVLRRCHYIVVSDAGADPKFSFDDLGNAIRKIRTDLGVPIEIIERIYMEPRAEDGKFGEGRYVARASIRYSAVDAGGKDGTLIYLKAGIYKNDAFLPSDIYNYAQGSPLFPHEPTSDQFFTESQFESYRALGRHVINDICANYTPDASVTVKPDATRIPIAKRFRSITAFDEVVRANASPPA